MLFNNEQTFFLKILADHLHKRETLQMEDIDWEKLLYIADKHQLTAIVYYQCKSFIPIDILDRYKSTYFSTLKAYANRVDLLKLITESLRSGEIDFAIIKGPNIARCYPVPALRTMGDLDIIVKKKSAAEPFVTGCGFNRVIDNTTSEWKYFYNEFELELHNNLIEVPVDSVEDEYKDFFNDTWSHMSDDKIEDNYHFVLMLRHMRKHIIGSGIGFRLFFDIATQIMYNKNLDFDIISDYLRTVTMKPFANKCFDLCRRWFEIELPFECQKVSEDFYIESTHVIFKNGIFGYGNENNKKAFVTNRYIGEKYPRISMVKRAAKFLFPSYKVIKEKYPFFNKKPYLLPIGWLYRGIDSIIKGKGEKGKENLIDSFSSKKKINARKELYNKWSL